jgi:hypothetical protein
MHVLQTFNHRFHSMNQFSACFHEHRTVSVHALGECNEGAPLAYNWYCFEPASNALTAKLCNITAKLSEALGSLLLLEASLSSFAAEDPSKCGCLLVLLLQAVMIKLSDNNKATIRVPAVPRTFLAKCFPDLQQQHGARQAVQLRCVVDGADSTPAGASLKLCMPCVCQTTSQRCKKLNQQELLTTVRCA